MNQDTNQVNPGIQLDFEPIGMLHGEGLAAAAVAQFAGVEKKTIEKVKGTVAVGKTVLGAGAAVTSATGLTVVATSGAGITSGLAAAGGIVGGGMAVGPAVIAAGPAYLASYGINNTLFKDDESCCSEERRARKMARYGTNVGAGAGLLGVGAATVAGGASGSAIMGTLAGVGGVVGGGAIAGTVVLAAVPVVTAAALGVWIYKRFGGAR